MKKQLDLSFLKEGSPWLVPESIDFLKTIIKPNMSIFETGCGGSTIFFAKFGVNVLSYETKKFWVNLVKQELKSKELINKVEVKWDPSYPKKGFKLNSSTLYDIALIDGRGRVKTIFDIHNNIKSSGWIILDNSERYRYRKAIQLLNEKFSKPINFQCYGPLGKPWRTTFWKKR